MQNWETGDLPTSPDHTSPDEVTEIRLLPSFEAGELAHATAHPSASQLPRSWQELRSSTTSCVVMGSCGECSEVSRRSSSLCQGAV